MVFLEVRQDLRTPEARLDLGTQVVPPHPMLRILAYNFGRRLSVYQKSGRTEGPQTLKTSEGIPY